MESLPQDILKHIGLYLTLDDIHRYCAVSKTIRKIHTDPYFWRDMVKKNYPNHLLESDHPLDDYYGLFMNLEGIKRQSVADQQNDDLGYLDDTLSRDPVIISLRRQLEEREAEITEKFLINQTAIDEIIDRAETLKKNGERRRTRKPKYRAIVNSKAFNQYSSNLFFSGDITYLSEWLPGYDFVEDDLIGLFPDKPNPDSREPPPLLFYVYKDTDTFRQSLHTDLTRMRGRPTCQMSVMMEREGLTRDELVRKYQLPFDFK